MNYLPRTGFASILFYIINGCAAHSKQTESTGTEPDSSLTKIDTVIVLPIDTVLYNEKMEQLANGDKSGRWPPKTVYPKKELYCHSIVSLPITEIFILLKWVCLVHIRQMK